VTSSDNRNEASCKESNCSKGKCLSIDNCKECENGHYNSLENQENCFLCPEGHFCNGTGLVNATRCIVGHYCPQAGMVLPKPCPSKTFCPQRNMTTPFLCPPGYFCPNGRVINPEKCPLDYYCPGETDFPIPCSIMKYSETGSSSCKMAPIFYIILIVVLAFITLISLIILKYIRNRSSKRESVADVQETTSLTIPEPEGPQYSGL